ncbi:hypothetical protein L1887_30963 [Cichorium endivia]|nr:hypothetical protein L1887_30963 [Cichorium endivia]
MDLISNLYRRITHSSSKSKSCRLYLEQYALFCAVGDPKLLRRSLQSARENAVDIHSKVVLSVWLRYERRGDELVGISAMDFIGKILECPKSAFIDNVYHPSHFVFDRCQCVCENDSRNVNFTDSPSSFNNEFLVHVNDDESVWFCIGDKAGNRDASKGGRRSRAVIQGRDTPDVAEEVEPIDHFDF